MKPVDLADLDERTRAAATELMRVIAAHHPTASFEVARGADEPENIHVMAVVDLDETDEVLDLVIDRVVELQVEDRIPLHVIPVRTPERILADLEARRGAADGRPPRALVHTPAAPR